MQARDFFDEPQAEPVRTPAREPRAEAPRQQSPSLPVAPAESMVVFHAVSEHDAAGEEAHKPMRRRRQSQPGDATQEAQLQLVETQAEAAAPVAALEDDVPRRSRPRKRRGGPLASEPLKLVETQGTPPEGAHPDSQP